jgi:hypothetical protein
VPPGEIQLQKTAQPDELVEPGGWVTFTFALQNTSRVTVTIDSLVDSVYGPLQQWPGSTCSVPQTLGPAGFYACAIHAEVTGTLGVRQDTVTALGTSWYQEPVSNTATAEVLLVGLPPVISVAKVANPTTIKEPGGDILYSVTVTNNSAASDPVTLTSLTDDKYGNLTAAGNPAITASTCTLVTIQPKQAYACTFKAEVSGVSGKTIVDTVTAIGADDDGDPAQASDDAKVTIVAEPPDTGIGLRAAAVAGGAMVVGLALLLAGVLLRRRTP